MLCEMIDSRCPETATHQGLRGLHHPAIPLRITSFYGRRDHLVKEELPDGVLAYCGRVISGLSPQVAEDYQTCWTCADRWRKAEGGQLPHERVWIRYACEWHMKMHRGQGWRWRRLDLVKEKV